MADQNSRQRGFCPGVFTPMAAGDGLIVRPRIRRGRLRAPELLAIANASRMFGNGVVELTRRANLQLRGISERSLPDLQAELQRWGLASSERTLTVALCPRAALEAGGARLELVADSLEALGSGAPESLSDKFLIVVGGGHDPFDDLHADVRVDLTPEADVARVRVAGTGQSALELGFCKTADSAQVVKELLAALASPPGARRLRDHVAAHGPHALRAIFARLPALDVGFTPAMFRARAASDCLGFHAAEQSWLGLTSDFGWVHADDLAGIARLAEELGSGALLLTPQRELLVVGIDAAPAAELARRARQHHFSAERSLPHVAMTACSGAPACRSAQGETRALAAELARLVNAAIAPRRRLAARGAARLSLHVSGCEKGCARTVPADITVVHAADGSRLGFGTGVAEASHTRPLTLDALRARVLDSLPGGP
jgi:precorrin-3B synthase